jgi:hypothetical protein
MAFECFIPRSYTYKNLAKIRRANELLEEYAAMGLTFTVRQLYYAFVAENLIANTFREYKNFCELMKDARLSGHVDWDGIEDRTRNLENYSMWDDPEQALQSMVKNYIEDAWATQPSYCEVWIEKEALMGVLQRPCWKYRLPFMACRGYTSVSEIYVAAGRLRERMDDGKKAIILHAGDHDPSGKDMSRDNFDRLNLLSGECGIEIRRIALNMDQIKRYNPPHQWAKTSDTRHRGYVRDTGTEHSWELDALKPDALMEIISTAVEPIIDQEKWDAHMAREQEKRAYIKDVWTRGKKWREFREARDVRG